MNYVDPKITTLSETVDGTTYSRSFYCDLIGLKNVSDETHPDWNSSDTYNVGDYVIVPTLKTIYRNTLENNSNRYPPAYPDDWVVFGVTNSYAMFALDEDIGASTTGTDVCVKLDFAYSDSLVVIDVDFNEVDIIQLNTEGVNFISDYDPAYNYMTDDGVMYEDKLYVSLIDNNQGNQPDTSNDWEERVDAIVYSKTEYGRNIDCLDFGTYYYTSFTIVKRFIINDMVWLPESIVRLTFKDEASIGTVCTGLLDTIGCALYGTKLSYESSSLFTTNPYTGFRTITRQGNYRVLDVEVLFTTNDFNTLSLKIEGIIDKNVVWIPTDQDRFSELITLGYIENFVLPIEIDEQTKTDTRIIGVHK